jgi:hypothetical protein
MVMVVITSFVLAGLAVMSIASQQAFSVGGVKAQLKAQAIAEAGANEAYAILKADWAKREDASAFPETDFGADPGVEAGYDATVTPVGANQALISCEGWYGSQRASVMCDVKNFAIVEEIPPEDLPPVGAYAFAVVAGSITWGGNGPTDVGTGEIQCNGTYDMNGTVDLTCDKLWSVDRVRSVGNCTITGDAEAPAYANKSPGNISGVATVGAVAPVVLPDLDLAAYFQYALSNGEVYDSDPGTYAPVGGVMWVKGDVQISGGAAIAGCIIAQGDIKVTGNSSQTKVGDLPAYISRDGDIELNSCGSHHGLIYAMQGTIKMAGGGSVTGTILSAGEFTKQGAWSAIVYEDSTPPEDPADLPGDESAEDQIGITCWHK